MTGSADSLRPDNHDVRHRISAFAIETNGVGNSSDYHINRTRSLADQWRERPAPQPRRKRPVPMGRPPGPPEPTSLPYAGKETVALPSSTFLRLKAADGRWLHMSGQGFTVVKADSWIGTAAQLFKLREAHPDLNAMTVSEP